MENNEREIRHYMVMDTRSPFYMSEFRGYETEDNGRRFVTDADHEDYSHPLEFCQEV